MSRQSAAKELQGYVEIPVAHVCANCDHYLSDITTTKGVFGCTYQIEKRKRCAIGGFAVKKTASCDEFEMDTLK